jgi:hypothetical protein
MALFFGMNVQSKQKTSWLPTIIAVSVFLVAIIALNWILPIFFIPGPGWGDRGAFGQLFGPATALFTGMGIVGVLYTIRLQQTQIQMTERSQAEAQKTIERQLWILNKQTRILRKNLIVQAQSSVADRQLNVDRMFVEYPDIRECFTDGVSLGPGDPRYLRVLAASQCLANYFDTYILQKGKFAQLYSDAAWIDYISGHLTRSPMLRQFVADHPSWYTDDLVQLASAAEQRSAAASGN